MNCGSCCRAKPQQKPFSAGAFPVQSHHCHSPCPLLSPQLSWTPPHAWAAPHRSWAEVRVACSCWGEGVGVGLGFFSRLRAQVFAGSPSRGTPGCGGVGGGPSETQRAPSFPPCPWRRDRWQLLDRGICCSTFQRCISAACPAVGRLVVAPVQEGVKPFPVEQLGGVQDLAQPPGTPSPRGDTLAPIHGWVSSGIGAAGGGTEVGVLAGAGADRLVHLPEMLVVAVTAIWGGFGGCLAPAGVSDPPAWPTWPVRV